MASRPAGCRFLWYFYFLVGICCARTRQIKPTPRSDPTNHHNLPLTLDTYTGVGEPLNETSVGIEHGTWERLGDGVTVTV